jgi:hypothetical protein
MKTQTAVDFIETEIVEMQNRYISLSKKDKKNSKGVDAILTATTLLKMKLKQAKQMEHDHTTAQIEALRERFRSKFFGIYGDLCDEIINNFLKEINDGK